MDGQVICMYTYRRVKTKETVRQLGSNFETKFRPAQFFSVRGSREFLYFVWFREPMSKLLPFYHYLRGSCLFGSGLPESRIL